MGNVFTDFLQGASNASAGAVSAPVDGLAWLLRKAGVPVGDAPVGGSQWMANVGLTAQPQNRTAGLLGETAGGVGPMLAEAYAPQIARGLIATEDAAKQAAMAVGQKAAGMAGDYMAQTGLLQQVRATNVLDKASSLNSAAPSGMNVKFVLGKWTDRPSISDDGTVIIPMPSRAQNPMSQYRDIALDLANDKYAPKYDGFFRFTNNKNEIGLASAGQLRNSMNHADNVAENGVSVASGPHYSVQGYKYGYRVDGDVIGYGSDGEPLLDPKTIKVLSPMSNARDIAVNDGKLQAAILKSANLPADYMYNVNFLNKPEDVFK